jgi:intein-encoded DNA endonuclease-like protein
VNELIEEDGNWFYFVGFMLADGSISHNTVQINICNKDREILEKIAIWLDLRTGVHTYKAAENSFTTEDRCMIAFNSKIIIDRLGNYGVVARKTGYEDYRNIPDEYYFDFLRGFMDGDGCSSRGRMAFYSNEALINKIESEVYTKLGVSGTVRYDSSIIWRLTYNIRDSVIIASSMYKNAELFLSRKRDNFKGGD